MAFARISSPHAHGPLGTGAVMRLVIYALIPGVVALTHFFGWGVLINILVASVTALACEAWVIKLRKRPLMFYLKDCSALVTALL